MKHILIGLAFCTAALFFSCGDFFTTSLAGWAQRDPSSLIPPVTTGNVAELLELTENNPDQSLALLKGIRDAGANPELQAAALQAAANASGLGAAIFRHADDISNISETDMKGIVIDALRGLDNVVETGSVLEEILPDPSDTAAWNAFVDASGAEDLAMAAVVLLAGKARGENDPGSYIDNFQSTTGSAEKLAKELALAAQAKHTGGGFLEDMLNGLHLI
ncbi:MAG: hypothetical protein LBP69_10560 [Treponema sp.]|jgi:hypothetical protein|nr:hypothetical protein [Treponema sp.]